MELADSVSLRAAPPGENRQDYPTGRMQKGLTLVFKDVDLSEEGVGFGVPVLKQRFDTIFPGRMRVVTRSEDASLLTVEYEMSLVGRLSMRGRTLLKGRLLNTAKEALALLHRKFPLLRRALIAASCALRSLFALKTVFQPVDSAGTIELEYRIDREEGKVHLRADARGARKGRCTELIFMNEQGANHFDRYRDSDGLSLTGEAIGTWFEVRAREASFFDPRHGVSFTVTRTSGARLFSGRELIEGRFAWAGFAYVLPPSAEVFKYTVWIGTRS